MATGGRAQTLAGMREFIWAVTARSRGMRKARNELKDRRAETRKLVNLLERSDPLGPAKGKDQGLLNQAIQ
ncbi:MAG: hypothetical protein ACK2T5_14640, partial [Anaerolineales bacterium]